jgi:hypothetical protein
MTPASPEGIRVSLREVKGISHDEIASILRRRTTGDTVMVTGVRVATRAPAVRSCQRIVFATLDDAKDLVDLTFFESCRTGAQPAGPWPDPPRAPGRWPPR